MKKKKKKYFLSISFCYHDSSIAISDEKNILIHVESERYFRIKHHRFKSVEEVELLLSVVLKELGIHIDDIVKVYLTKWNNLYSINNGTIKILNKEFKPILTSHHNNHIATAFPSNYKKCIILCSDGGSEDGFSKLYYKKGKKIWCVDTLDERIFTGKFYGTIAQLIITPKGSEAHVSGVGKLMGLSALGEYNEEIAKKIIENKNEINKLYFNDIKPLMSKFNLDNNYIDVWKQKYRRNFATTAHKIWVNECYNYLKKHTKFSNKICIVGGCGLNISLNSKLLDTNLFKKVYISPVSSDSGQSIGALLYHNRKLKCDYPYLGRGYSSDILYDKEIINDLLKNKVIAWYQGRSESGARALGHRSFIGIPTSNNNKKRISEKIKGREPYRPVAAIIAKEDVEKYFHQNYNSPYMTFCAKAKDITKKVAPAIVHDDDTTRVQTITKKENPIIYDILMELKKNGKPPILMNTSLNVMGDPISDTEEDAIQTYLKSKADKLYINGSCYRNKKLITIIIATYKNQMTLTKTLESLKNNGVLEDKNIEVIIVENCNLEKEYKKTKNLEKKFNISVYHEKRQSKSYALNCGITKSAGEYIYTTDDDVIIADKDWLYKFINIFETNPNISYVSGKVVMYSDDATTESKLWEDKGGLSKGDHIKHWDEQFLSKKKYIIFPWPLHKICAGANQMIRKKTLLEIGGYSEFLGRKNTVDGLTLEIGYRIIKAKKEIMYDPNIVIYHKHPKTKKEIKEKLYYYGLQDTGVSLYIFLTNKDFRYLWWSIFGHSFYTLKKMGLSLIGKYPLSIVYLCHGLKGNIKGTYKCLFSYWREKWKLFLMKK